MSTEKSESYVDTLWPKLAERPAREALVARMISTMRSLVIVHAEPYNDPGQPIHVPPVPWGGHPTRRAWMDLEGWDGEQIGETATEDQEPGTTLADLVGRASFMVDDQGGPDRGSMEAFTVTVTPPDVLGHDGEPLDVAALQGALNDLQLFAAHLEGDA